ncbi:MAG: 30S ribosomal protein S20, partial [Specibacter sp.]
MANIKSQKKRILTNEKARQRNLSVRSELKTAIRAVNTAVAKDDKDAAVVALVNAGRKLDKAV